MAKSGLAIYFWEQCKLLITFLESYVAVYVSRIIKMVIFFDPILF